jgi:hypothetical protein
MQGTMANNGQAIMQTARAAVTAQQQFVIDSFRGQIYISDTLDVQDTPVYDTVILNAGQSLTTTTSTLFADVAPVTSGKTVAQTNMTQNQQLPAPEAMSVFGIRIGWQEWIYYLDLQSLLTNWEFEFWLGKKSYQQANLRHFGAGWGITGYTTLTGTQFLTNGSTDSRSMHILAIKLVIANQQAFYALLNGGSTQVLSASGTGLNLLCELNGLYARGVQ